MPAIVRPKQQVLFSDRPRGQITADLLDAQIHNLIEAIHSTQLALEDIRRDDGKLKSGSVGRDQLTLEIKHSREEIESIEDRTLDAAMHVAANTARTIATWREVDLRAKDAEAAAVTTANMLSAISHGNVTALDATSDAENSADRAESAAIQSQNSANFSSANADNAIAAKNEATQWAEYLAGPVVNPEDAPAYISGHPYGHGLYYQPVEGGVAGLWSAKWWALYAQQLVGVWHFYYLGAWNHPPIAGETNPATGQVVPNPIAVGSFYYDINTQTLMVWNGSQWVASVALTSGYEARFVYVAAEGQQMFTGPDVNGATPAVNGSPSTVHINGVALIGESTGITPDYTIDMVTNTLALSAGVPAGTVVMWDLLVSRDKLAPTLALAIKLDPITPNGTLQDFALTYTDPINGTPGMAPDIGRGEQLQVSLDGIVQEPGADYTAAGNSIHFLNAPTASQRVWIVWFRGEGATPP